MFPFIFLSSGSKYDLFHISQSEICLQCLTSFLQHATCMCFRRQTVCRSNSSEVNAKNKLFKTNKQTNNNNELKQFFQLMLLRKKKKKSPQKWVLFGFEHRPLRYRCKALTIELVSQLRAGPFLFLFLFWRLSFCYC